MRASAGLAATLLCLGAGGCSWVWPTVVRTDPREPLFHTGFPLVGPLRLDAALCSLLTIGQCEARREAYAIFLSDTDPALGDAQREFAERCHFPLRRAGVPGHTPLACRLELFDEMIAEVRLAPRTSAAVVTSWARIPGTPPASTEGC